MPEDDIVETSDVEEREVLRLGGGFPGIATSHRQPRDTPRFETPRKRRKYGHSSTSQDFQDLSPFTGPSSSLAATAHISASPSATSMYDTPTTSLRRLSSQRTRVTSAKHSVAPNDHLSFSRGYEYSQDDELDLLSSENNEPEDIVPLRRLPLSTPLREYPYHPDTIRSLTDKEASSSPSNKDSLGSARTREKTGTGDMLLSEATSPPASSPRTSSSVVDIHSPAEETMQDSGVPLLQSMQAVSIQAQQDHASEDIPQDLLADAQSSRRYSLRTRQARQLNPYSIEKHFYKQQMRYNPDAMVKVVSPRRFHGEHGHTERNEWDEDFVVPENETQSSPRRRRNRLSEETDEVPKRWMPEAFSMFEEDDLTTPGPGHAKSGQVSPKHRHKPQKFPMRVPRAVLNDQDVSASGTSENMSRRKDPEIVSSQQSASPARRSPPQIEVSLPDDSSAVIFDQTNFSLIDDDGFVAGFETDYTTPHVEPQEESPDEKSMSSSDEDSLGLNRQQRKALSRVMPKFMINRMLKKQQAEAKPQRKTQRTASPDRLSSDGSHHGANSSQGALPRAGRSRIRRRDNVSLSAQLPIKGDTESSESDLDLREAVAAPASNSTVIEIKSDSSSDSSDESEVETLDAVHPQARRSPGPRYETSLIDRMLSRTRTGIKSKKKKGKRRQGYEGGKRPNYDYLDMRVGFDRSGPARVHSRHTGKQGKLPYAPRDTSVGSEVPSDRRSGPLDEVIDVDIEALPDPYKKLSKKERREALRKNGVHTFASSGRMIGHGRKKGHMQVQIDMADDDLRYALQPLDSNMPRGPSCHRAPDISGHSKRPRPRISGGHRTPGIDTMKQSFLHDFAYPVEGVEIDFQPSTYRYPSPPESEHQMDRVDEAKLAECTIDLDIAAPSPGRMFSTSSYLGKQGLSDLLDFLKGDYIVTSPPHFNELEIELDAYAPPGSLCNSFEAVHNLICEDLEKNDIAASEESEFLQIERLSRAMFLHVPWAISKADQETCCRINNTLNDLTLRAVEKIQPWFDEPYKTRDRLNERLFAVLWFLVETNTRAYVQTTRRGLQADHLAWKQVVVLTMRFLILYGVEGAVEAVCTPELPSSGLPIRIAGIWISLVHMIPHIHALPLDSNASYGTFWSLLLEVVKTDRLNFGSDVELSEKLWRLIFSLSSLSRFSIRGVCTSDTHLPFSWDFVSYVLDTIRLSGDAIRDANLPRSSLRKRDKYVRIVVARCFLLSMRWKWPLRNAQAMLKRLIDIFKSRSFGNLVGEKPDFPAFLRHYDLSLMSTLDRSDTAFNLFLKLVVHAVKSNSGAIEMEQREKARITKLLSLAIPLSKVSFTKATPPVGEELSLLVNRYSAIITAIYVEPTPENVRVRLSRARSYLDFLNADDLGRAVCIRAVMYSAVLVNHLSLPLDEPVGWLTEIGDALLTEYRATYREMQSKPLQERQAYEAVLRRIRTTVQLLLGCMRNIVERPRFADSHPTDDRPVYPEVALIKGPWIKAVLSMKDLTADVDIRHQVLLLVRAFLDARVKVMGVPKRSAMSYAEDENSESQELYGDFALDAELLEALDRSEGLVMSEGQSLMQKNKAKDMEVAEAMNSDIIQNIFRLLLQYLLESREARQHDMTLERFWFNANEWIDCWVSCASVVVQNGLREWDHFMEVGPQSWGGISDSFFRRRVALRFMYKLLQCDPTAYKEERLSFLKVFVEALSALNITIEHEYVSLLLSINGFRPGLLSGLLVARNESGDIDLTKQQFLDLRPGFISTIFDNLSDALDAAGDRRLTYKVGTFVEIVVALLSAMQDIWTSLTEVNDREKYVMFCRHVHACAAKHPRVADLQRLVPFISWASAFSEEA